MRTSGNGLIAKLLAAATLIALLPVGGASAAELPSQFLTYANSAPLANAGILIENLATREILFQSETTTLRAPASVLKLLSMATTLSTFDSDTRFTTTIASTAKPNKFLLIGESDPWLTTSAHSAAKCHRAYLPYLINKVRLANPKLKAIQLDYANVYTLDLHALQKFFGSSFKIYPHKLSTVADAQAERLSNIAEIKSPPLSEIIKFTLLWSDNALADRLAHMSAAKMGFGSRSNAVQSAFEAVLKENEVSAEGLAVFDGNGLSHKTEISAATITGLLIAIRNNPNFQPIYDGLPLAGHTGTLKDRFVKDAPAAVGLIKAKTGWINTTVSLAGFVKSGTDEYVFTVIDSGLRNNETVRARARIAIDRMLATLVKN